MSFLRCSVSDINWAWHIFSIYMLMTETLRHLLLSLSALTQFEVLCVLFTWEVVCSGWSCNTNLMCNRGN